MERSQKKQVEEQSLLLVPPLKKKLQASLIQQLALGPVCQKLPPRPAMTNQHKRDSRKLHPHFSNTLLHTRTQTRIFNHPSLPPHST